MYEVAFDRALHKKSVKHLCYKVNQFILVEGYLIKPSPLNNLVGCYHWRLHLAFLGSRLQLILYSFLNYVLMTDPVGYFLSSQLHTNVIP